MIKEQAVALVKKAIKRLSWKYQYDDEDDIFTIKWRPVYAYASIKMSIYIFDKFLTIIVGSETIVKKNISLVAEYLTRLNYRLATTEKSVTITVLVLPKSPLTMTKKRTAWPCSFAACWSKPL